MLLLRFFIAVVSPIPWGITPPISEGDMTAIANQGVCIEYLDEALNAGWPSHDLPRLLAIMHRESRCIPTACSVPDRPDQRKCRDWGLMQINDYSWKRHAKAQGFAMRDMFDPLANLIFARWLFELSEETNGCGWQPWNGKC